MFFARFAASGRTTAVQAYGFGWAFVHLGDFIGVVAITMLGGLRTEGLVAANEIAASSIAVLTVLTMFLVGSTKGSSLDSAVQAGKPSDAETAGQVPVEKTGTARGEGEGFEGRIRILSQSHGLTPRETEVFGLLARGRSVPFIRDALVISRDTAATHVKHVYVKLDVHSRQELIDLVYGEGA
jgi:DNA-binding CsgD family transcriptional regulator